jgi:hypothetical protein
MQFSLCFQTGGWLKFFSLTNFSHGAKGDPNMLLGYHELGMSRNKQGHSLHTEAWVELGLLRQHARS